MLDKHGAEEASGVNSEANGQDKTELVQTIDSSLPQARSSVAGEEDGIMKDRPQTP